MKKSAAIFFLVILSLPAVYKAGFFAFYELNRDFIAANYCINRDKPMTMCYGSCFLERGLQLADETPHPDKITVQVKSEMPASMPYQLEPSLFLTATSSVSRPSTTAPSLADGVTSFVFRPPLVLV